MTTPRKKGTKAKAQAAPQEVRGFSVTIGENGFNVENNSFNDIEMVGILTVLLDTYRERFNVVPTEGGGTNGKS